MMTIVYDDPCDNGSVINRCEGGLAGLQRQGVCNSFLSKMIMKCDKVFMVCVHYLSLCNMLWSPILLYRMMTRCG